MKTFVQNLGVICVLSAIVCAVASVIYFAITQGIM